MKLPEINCIYQLHDIKRRGRKGYYLPCEQCIYYDTPQCKKFKKGEAQDEKAVL